MSIFNIFLAIHVTGGVTGLLTGILSLSAQKGGSVHTKSGVLFYFAMLTVAATSFVLATLHYAEGAGKSSFLFAVGVFTGYMTLTGRRYLTQKQKGLVNQTDNFEKILAAIMFVFSLYFLYLGVVLLLKQAYFGLVFLFFAQTTLRMVWADYQVISGKNTTPTLWLRMHITRMTGAWIAAFTAFLVVNADKLTAVLGDGFAGRSSIIVWIAPAAVGTFFIIYWLRKMKV
jgi:uncharacterized membrane protein